MLVLDASVVLAGCRVDGGLGALGDSELAAPPFMWSEARSALHEALWRAEIARDDAEAILARLERAPVLARRYARLGADAWQLADELGWAKTYDTEYLALARHLRCPFVTLDARLRRGADRLGFVISPSEL